MMKNHSPLFLLRYLALVFAIMTGMTLAAEETTFKREMFKQPEKKQLDPFERLVLAARHEDVKAMKKLLEKHDDILNMRHPETGQTVLMTSTLSGKTKSVEYLLTTAGADPSIAEKDGYTPPHGAGFQGRVDAMRILHRFGLDVMEPHDGDGFTPFHRACWGNTLGHTDTVRYLLDAVKVDPNLPGGKEGRTCWEMTRNKHTQSVLQAYGGGPPPEEQGGDQEKKEEL